MVQQVRVEGLVHTKADIVGEQIKGVALATDLKDVSSIPYCCYVMCLLMSERNATMMIIKRDPL